MLEITFDGFEWRRPVARHGFAWATDADPVLVELPGASFETYRPAVSFPALFRDFAELGTREKILHFANAHGRLDYFVGHGGRLEDSRPPFTLSMWEDRVKQMRNLVALVDGLASSDLMPQRQEMLAHAKAARSYADSGKVQLGGLGTIHDVVNVAAMPLLGKLRHATFGREWNGEFSWDEKAARPRLSLIPKSLDHFLDWQLVRSFFLFLTFYRCAVCGRWKQTKRPDCAKVCSDACRDKLCRQRQKTAQEMADQGFTAKQIATELGADLARVKTWISSTKRSDDHGKKTKRAR